MITKTLMAASTRPIILSILSGKEDYGYNIIQKVKKISGGNLEWTDGMLYSVLQRMEMDGVVTSQWKIDGESRPRRYFRITEEGRQVLATEMDNWKQILKAMTLFSRQHPAEP
jgi:PadR family transcriptional regulator PadR